MENFLYMKTQILIFFFLQTNIKLIKCYKYYLYYIMDHVIFIIRIILYNKNNHFVSHFTLSGIDHLSEDNYYFSNDLFTRI